MTTATIRPTPKNFKVDAFNALLVLRNSSQAGPELTAQALQAMGAKKGREVAVHRVRYYGPDFLTDDRRWEIADLKKVILDLEGQIHRPLDEDERRLFMDSALDAVAAVV